MKTLHAGFTLIELMIVVAIVAILAALAYPAYQEQVQQTRRANAQADLLELASYMERLYTQNFSYANANLPFAESPKQGNRKFYDLAVVSDANSYTLTATPKGGQAGDRCGNMTLDEVNQRGAAQADCW